MLNLDIDLLRAFVAVADTGGFTSASRQLHRTQSAVSLQVKRIEAMLGKRVFDRSSRSVKITADGEVLLGHARRMLKINEEVAADLITPEIEGVVRLGIPDSYGTYYLPRILSNFSQVYPRVQLEVKSELTGQMIKSLDRGDMDLALVVTEPAFPHGDTLWSEPLVWVGTKEFPIYDQNPLPMALFPQSCTDRSRSLQALDDFGLRWRMVFCSSSLAAIQAAALAGLGIAVLPSSSVLPGMHILGPTEGLPKLPSSAVELRRSLSAPSIAIDQLAKHIMEKLGGWTKVPAPILASSDDIPPKFSHAG
jgi:DNA-binding transcriptional LysR family regulator